MPDTLEITEAAICVERLVDCQRALSLNDAAFVRRFPLLGSARTWRRLALKEWDTAPADVWLPKLQETVACIETGRVPVMGVADLAPESPAAPTALVTRHLVEADRCRREKHLSLARSHCRAARQAIENFQRTLK